MTQALEERRTDKAQRAPVLCTLSFLLSALLFGCSHAPSAPPYAAGGDAAPAEPFDASAVPDAVPRVEARSRYGNPDSYVVFGRRYHVLDSADGFRERGLASWYGTKFHGRRTSSGEPYDMYAMTAAHKTLPLPTYVKVTNLNNGRSAIVRVNDRGPFHDGRVIDLSYAAALKLDVVATGTAPVEIVAIDPERLDEPGARLADAPEPVPGDVVEASPGGSLFIQLGAFSSEDNALGLKGRLETAGVRPVRIDPEPERRLFRVRVGPFDEPAGADEAALKLVAIGITEFDIVAE